MSSTGVRDSNDNNKRIIKGLIQNESQFIQSLRVFANTSTLSGLGSTEGEINNSPIDASGNYLSRLGDKMLGPLALNPPLDFTIEIDVNNTIDVGPLNDNAQYTSNVQLDSIQPNSFVLDIIAGAAFDGQLLFLRTFAPSLPFTISQGTLANGGNIQTGDGNDLTVGDLQIVALIFDEALKIEANTGGSWRVYSVSSGGGVSGGYNTIQDETIPLFQRSIMNFIGAGVTAVDNPAQNRTDITITGDASQWSTFVALQDVDMDTYSIFDIDSLEFVGGTVDGIVDAVIGITTIAPTIVPSEVGLRIQIIAGGKFRINEDSPAITPFEIDTFPSTTIASFNDTLLRIVDTANNDRFEIASTDSLISFTSNANDIMFNLLGNDIVKVETDGLTMQASKNIAGVGTLGLAVGGQGITSDGASTMELVTNSVLSIVTNDFGGGFEFAHFGAINISTPATRVPFLTLGNGTLILASILENDAGDSGASDVGRIFMNSDNNDHLSILRDTTVVDLESGGVDLLPSDNIWLGSNTFSVLGLLFNVNSPAITLGDNPATDIINIISKLGSNLDFNNKDATNIHTITFDATSGNIPVNSAVVAITAPNTGAPNNDIFGMEFNVPLEKGYFWKTQGSPLMAVFHDPADKDTVFELLNLENAAVPRIKFISLEGTPALNTVIGDIDFLSANDAATGVSYAGVEARVHSIIEDAEDGSLDLHAMFNGNAETVFLRINHLGDGQVDIFRDLDFNTNDGFDVDKLLFMSSPSDIVAGSELNKGFSSLTNGVRLNILNTGSFEVTEEEALRFSVNGLGNTVNVVNSIFKVQHTASATDFDIVKQAGTTELIEPAEMIFTIGVASVMTLIAGTMTMGTNVSIANAEQIGFQNLGNTIQSSLQGMRFVTIPQTAPNADDGTFIFADYLVDATPGKEFAQLDQDGFFLNSAFIQLDDIADPGNTNDVQVGKLFLNSANNHLSWRRSTTLIDLESGGGGGEFTGPWTQNHDAGDFALENITSLSSSGALDIEITAENVNLELITNNNNSDLKLTTNASDSDIILSSADDLRFDAADDISFDAADNISLDTADGDITITANGTGARGLITMDADNDIIFKINNVTQFSIFGTETRFSTSPITMFGNAAQLDFNGSFSGASISPPTQPNSVTLFLDSDNNELSVIKENGAVVVSLEGGGGGGDPSTWANFTAISDVDFGTFNALRIDSLEQEDTGHTLQHTFVRPETLADDTDIGEIKFQAFDGQGALQNYAKIRGIMESDINTLEVGRLEFIVRDDDSSILYVNIDGDLKQVQIFKDLFMAGNKILNLATPTADSDAATKKYVDDNIGGGSFSFPIDFPEDVFTSAGTVTIDFTDSKRHSIIITMPGTLTLNLQGTTSLKTQIASFKLKQDGVGGRQFTGFSQTVLNEQVIIDAVDANNAPNGFTEFVVEFLDGFFTAYLKSGNNVIGGGGGTSDLSGLTIDVDKNWNDKQITNLGNLIPGGTDRDLGSASDNWDELWVNKLRGGTIDVDASTFDINSATINIGSAAGDDINFKGEIISNIVPDASNTHSLGETGKVWDNLWVNVIVSDGQLDIQSSTKIVLGAPSNPIDISGDIIAPIIMKNSAATGSNPIGEGRFFAKDDGNGVTIPFWKDSNNVETPLVGTTGGSNNQIFEMDTSVTVTDTGGNGSVITIIDSVQKFSIDDNSIAIGKLPMRGITEIDFFDSTGATGATLGQESISVFSLDLLGSTSEFKLEFSGNLAFSVDVNKTTIFPTGPNTQSAKLSLFRDDPSPNNNDTIGEIQFIGKNDAAASIEYGKIELDILDTTAGTENSVMRFWHKSNSFDVNILTLADGRLLLTSHADGIGSQIAEMRIIREDNSPLDGVTIGDLDFGIFDSGIFTTYATIRTIASDIEDAGQLAIRVLLDGDAEPSDALIIEGSPVNADVHFLTAINGDAVMRPLSGNMAYFVTPQTGIDFLDNVGQSGTLEFPRIDDGNPGLVELNAAAGQYPDVSLVVHDISDGTLYVKVSNTSWDAYARTGTVT